MTMNITILSLSILLQFAAAGMAIGQIRLTGRKIAWGCVASALILMGVRRSITWYRVISEDLALQPDPTAELVALFISALMLAGVVLIGRLFHEVRETEAELQRSEQRFKGLFDNAEVSIWNEDFSEARKMLNKLHRTDIQDLRQYLRDNEQVAWDMSRMVNVLNVNDATLTLFGAKSEEELLGQIDKTFGPNAIDVFIDELCAIWDRKSHFVSEAAYRTLDGRDLFAIISFNIPATEDGFKSIPVSIVDITDRKRIEAEVQASLLEAERASQVKSVFLANMSHEIRTPLNGVLGMTEILLASRPNQSDVKKLEVIRECGETLLSFLSDILDLSKLEAGRIKLNLQVIAIRDMLESVMNVFPYQADKKKLDLIIDIDDRVPAKIQADPAKLRQIMINLVGNAMKFTESGSITTRVALPADKPGFIEFSVLDTGIGIDVAHQDTLFERFSQVDQSAAREYGGAGLGLAISREIITLMGGYIDVESQLGQGSRFYFGLPLDGAEDIAMSA